MQAKFALYTELWDGVLLLKTKLSAFLESFKNGEISQIGVSALSPMEKETFIATIRTAITNMDVRFPCPSTSLSKRHLRNTQGSRDGAVDKRLVARAYSACPLGLLFDVYDFPGEFLLRSTVKACLLSSFDGEVERLCIEMNRIRDRL